MNSTAVVENPLGNDPIFRLIVRFSLPAIVGMVVNALYNVVDRIYIGNAPNLGAHGIAGITIGFPIMIILMAFGVLFGIGGATLFSIRNGQKRTDEAEEALGNAFFLLVASGIIFMILGQIFLKPLLTLFGASAEVLPYSMAYMRVIFFGAAFQTTSMGLNHFIRGDGNPKVAMLTMFLGAGSNIVLDPIFIYGFGWGMAGAAWATILSQSFSFIWVTSYFLGKKSKAKLRLKHIRPRWAVVKRITVLGTPSFVLQITSSLLNAVLNMTLIKHGGDLGISAMGIVNSIQTLLLMPVIGINQGVIPIISFNYGAKKYDRVKQATRQGILSATALICIGYIATRTIPEVLVGMFNRDPQLLELGTYALKRWFLLTPITGFQIVSGIFFQAIGRSKTAMVMTLTRQGLFLIPAILILASLYGLQGILWAAPISDGLSTLIAAIFYIDGMKNLEKRALLREV